MSSAYFYRDEVARFQVLLEEATRARPGSPRARFVRPDSATVDRLGSRFHHVLFGRRGAGKSSLLRHVEADRREAGSLVAWTDQETFMGLSYPDVLVSTLEEVFIQFGQQIRDLRATSHGRWRKRKARGDKERVARLLDDVVAQLVALKAAPSEEEIEWTASYSRTLSAERATDGSAAASKGPLRLSLSGRRSRSSSQASGHGIVRRFSTTKSEHLERAIPTYRELMSSAGQLAPDGFIILDDFYRLSEIDQARIAGYFHRVVKDTGMWLKIGSIRYWTRLYSGGSPAVGVQVPHDIRELSLDRGLLDFKSSKRFVEDILSALAREAGVEVNLLLSEGARDRLVLASGGVPRDYLGLLGEAIAVAKNRGPSQRTGTERVIAEDVNEAAGRTVETKFSDLEEDAGSEALALRDLVVEVTNHCRKVESACFLVDYREDALIKQLNRLQNMRFIHTLDTNESLPDQSSSRYNVYLLDVSQLAAQRAWQVDFMGWQKREKRRVRKLVFRGPTETQDPVVRDQEPTQLPGKGLSGGKKTEDIAKGTQLSLDDALAVVGDVDPPVEAPE